jgi:hypothetical protein
VTAELVRWAQQVRADLDELGACLVDLDADPATALVQAGGLEGRTASAAQQANEALARAWALLPAIRRQLDAADEERAKGRRADGKRMEELLTGPTVVLTVPHPATLSVRDAMAQLVADHAAAAGVIGRIGAAWRDGLAAVDGARFRFDRLDGTIGPYPEADTARLALEEATGVAARDPLALGELAPGVVAAVDAAVAAHGVLVARRDRLGDDLAAAAADLARLDDTIRAGAVALGAAREKIAGPEGLLAPLDPVAVLDAGPRALRPWLDRIRALPASEWRAAVNGLAAWRTVAEGATTAAERVVAANRRPVERRNELRGLLGGLAAKAAARGRAEDPALAELHRAARELLWRAPCDLPAAAAAVDAFADAVTRGEPR